MHAVRIFVQSKPHRSNDVPEVSADKINRMTRLTEPSRITWHPAEGHVTSPLMVEAYHQLAIAQADVGFAADGEAELFQPAAA
ncbi:hypothetical protein [Xanthomonas hortorum]